jgi:hypothetical protein
MSSVPCALLRSGSLNTFPQTQTRGTIDLLLGNGAVNRLCQQYRLCFPWGPCKVDISESSSEASSCGRTRMERDLGSQRGRIRLKIDCDWDCTRRCQCIQLSNTEPIIIGHVEIWSLICVRKIYLYLGIIGGFYLFNFYVIPFTHNALSSWNVKHLNALFSRRVSLALD